MPSGPVRYKPPLPVRFKVNKGRLLFKKDPEIVLGKSLVAAAPQCVTAHHLETGRRMLRKALGKDKPFLMNVHATFARTKKSQGVKMGKGQGAISYFVARVNAGKPMITIPSLSNFPGVPSNLYTLKCIGDFMPMTCRLREQYNHFPELRESQRAETVRLLKVGHDEQREGGAGAGAGVAPGSRIHKYEFAKIGPLKDGAAGADAEAPRSSVGAVVEKRANREDADTASGRKDGPLVQRICGLAKKTNVGRVELQRRRGQSEAVMARYGATTRGECTAVARQALSSTAARLAGTRGFSSCSGARIMLSAANAADTRVLASCLLRHGRP